MDADPKQETLVRLVADRELVGAVLKRHRRTHRVDRAGKFRQQAIACALDEPAAVRGNRRHHDVCEQRGHAGMRRFLVRVHQHRIAGNVRHQDRGQPPFDAIAGNRILGIGVIHPRSPTKPP
jgi:hypothetical protein